MRSSDRLRPVDSNAVQRNRETADRASQTLSPNSLKSALNLEQSLPCFPALEEYGGNALAN